MHRGETGHYRITTHGGEEVRAFVPQPLPPEPPLQFDGPLLKALEAANRSLGRLDGISTLLPDKSLFLYHYVRKEAVLSSQIEGRPSSPRRSRGRSPHSPTCCSTREATLPEPPRTMSPRSPATSPRWSTGCGDSARTTSRSRTD